MGKKMVLAALALAGTAGFLHGEQAVVLRTARLLDGLGEVLRDRDVRIRDGRIEAIGNQTSQDGVVYDLRDLTVLPGLIDTHVHMEWHFGADGTLSTESSGETPEQAVLYALENAYATLMAGVTTVQSLGSAMDRALRDALERSSLPGPRILTSLRSIYGDTGNPEEIREVVDELVGQGADVIKIFASASIRDGGEPTMTQEQLDAACGEARKLGLRAVVHAHGPESAKRAVRAGCSAIEHGALLDRETLELIADQGVYFDPHVHLVFQNYFDNKERFLGIGNYTEEGFRQMERAVPSVLEVFRQGLRIAGLKMVFGTDAVAGAHGRSVEELIYRVQKGGQAPEAAIISATSLAAESLDLQDRVGAVQVGLAADIIGVEGSPLEDITALRRVRFVMKGGRVYKNEPPH